MTNFEVLFGLKYITMIRCDEWLKKWKTYRCGNMYSSRDSVITGVDDELMFRVSEAKCIEKRFSLQWKSWPIITYIDKPVFDKCIFLCNILQSVAVFHSLHTSFGLGTSKIKPRFTHLKIGIVNHNSNEPLFSIHWSGKCSLCTHIYTLSYRHHRLRMKVTQVKV